MSEYFKGVACLNGHEITGYVGYDHSAPADKFCTKCGAQTVSRCEHCQTAIRGKSTDGMNIKPWQVAAYCHACGKAYPWTQRKM